MQSIRSTLGIGILALLASGPLSAELYRCEGPDGGVLFTDQKGVCPEAEEYEPSGRVSSAPSDDASPAPARLRVPTTTGSHDENLARQWRQRRLDAEQALVEILERRELLRPAIYHCNRGGYVTVRDEAGIKRRMNCSVLKKDFASLEAHEARARAFLEQGLAEQCRKAGCLPGWIR